MLNIYLFILLNEVTCFYHNAFTFKEYQYILQRLFVNFNLSGIFKRVKYNMFGQFNKMGKLKISLAKVGKSVKLNIRILTLFERKTLHIITSSVKRTVIRIEFSKCHCMAGFQRKYLKLNILLSGLFFCFFVFFSAFNVGNLTIFQTLIYF